MASITTRAGKGSALTNAEVDANFTNLNTELGTMLTAALAASTYQPILVSGTSIKTVNGQSVLGSGNIQIDGGVVSFNTRTGAISLTSGDVTTALSFTPANKAGDTFTGDVVFDGKVASGSAVTASTNYRFGRGITGGVSASAFVQNGSVQSDVTTTAVSFNSQTNTAAAAFTLTNYFHYYAQQGVVGAGSAITAITGFFADSTLTGSTNTYGFRGSVGSGSGRWNLFMDGGANNHVAGAFLVGTTAAGASNIRSARNVGGAVSAFNYLSDGLVQSDVTSTAVSYRSALSTAAASFTLATLTHFQAAQGNIGAGSTVTTQEGFRADSSMVGAGSNIGFRGAIPSGSNRFNLYMDGTAANFLAGGLIINNNLGVGTAGSPSYGTTGQVLTSQGPGAAPTWTTVSGGGGGTVGQILETAATITSSYSIAAGNNGFSVGPVTIASGVSVTVPANRSWLITNTSPATAGNIATTGKSIAMAVVFGG